MNGIDWWAQAIKGPAPIYKQGTPYLGWANFYGTRDPLNEAFGFANAIAPTTGNVAWRQHDRGAGTIVVARTGKT
jgi:hypothetical protein